MRGGQIHRVFLFLKKGGVRCHIHKDNHSIHARYKSNKPRTAQSPFPITMVTLQRSSVKVSAEASFPVCRLEQKVIASAE